MTSAQRRRLYRAPQPIVWGKPTTVAGEFAVAYFRCFTREFDRKAGKRKRQARQRTGRRR